MIILVIFAVVLAMCLYSNDFSNLVPKIFANTLPSLRNNAIAVQVCRVDFAPETAKQGNVISVPVPVTSSATAVTAATTPAANTNKTPTTKAVTLDQWRRSDKFTMTAQEARNINDPVQFRQSQWYEQTIALVEEMNSVVLVGMKKASYRNVGTAGTTPYGSGVGTLSTINVRKQLLQAKTPSNDRHLILGPTAEAAALGLAQISDASLRGNAEAKDSGQIGKVFGLMHWGDQQVPAHTAGTASAKTVTVAVDSAVGDPTLTLKVSATTGTVVVGDIIIIGAYSYVVTANATLDTTGVAVSVSPAAQAIHVATTSATVAASHSANIGLQRGAYGLAIRPLNPADLGIGTHITMTDPLTGLAVTYSEIPEYMQMSYQVSVLYGHAVLRDDWLVRLLGDSTNP